MSGAMHLSERTVDDALEPLLACWVQSVVGQCPGQCAGLLKEPQEPLLRRDKLLLLQGQSGQLALESLGILVPPRLLKGQLGFLAGQLTGKLLLLKGQLLLLLMLKGQLGFLAGQLTGKLLLLKGQLLLLRRQRRSLLVHVDHVRVDALAFVQIS